MNIETDEKKTIIRPVRKFRCPLTPYQLFSPVSSVFLNNLSQEEQILGLYKQFNTFASKINEIIAETNRLADIVEDFPEQIEQLQNLITTLQNWVTNQILNIMAEIENSANRTLEASKNYTDDRLKDIDKLLDIYNPYTGEIENIQDIITIIYEYSRRNPITAKEYDVLELTAQTYDNYYYEDPDFPFHGSDMDWQDKHEFYKGIHAISYDFYGKTIFYPTRNLVYKTFWNYFSGTSFTQTQLNNQTPISFTANVENLVQSPDISVQSYSLYRLYPTSDKANTFTLGTDKKFHIKIEACCIPKEESSVDTWIANGGSPYWSNLGEGDYELYDTIGCFGNSIAPAGNLKPALRFTLTPPAGMTIDNDDGYGRAYISIEGILNINER